MLRIILVAIVIILTTITSYAHVQGISISIAPRDIQFHLKDATGAITGYTPTGVMKQIPGIEGYYDRTEPGIYEITKPSPYEQYHVIEADGIPNYINTGKYNLIIYGTNTSIIAQIGIELSWSDNLSWFAQYINKRLIYPNTVWTYEFDIPATPPANQQIVLIKVSTPADLIKDLTTAGQLGYIGNSEFVSEITKKINKIEEKRLKPDKNEEHGLTPAQKAKKEYTELLNEITEKYNKPESDEYVKKEAYDVLKEDIEYIIGHIQ